ncbi:MAG: hypothetical protein ABGZ19_00015 [Verrucomicrobiales bacterium]
MASSYSKRPCRSLFVGKAAALERLFLVDLAELGDTGDTPNFLRGLWVKSPIEMSFRYRGGPFYFYIF